MAQPVLISRVEGRGMAGGRGGVWVGVRVGA